MLLALETLGALMILELVLWLIPSVKIRRFGSTLLLLPLAAVSISLIAIHPSLPSLMLFIVSVYRLVNLLRVIKGRMNAEYLRRMASRASLWLIGIQLAVLLLWWLSWRLDITTYNLWVIFSGLELLGCIVLAASTFRNFRKTRVPAVHSSYADRDLPSLTVAIPARNETEDLKACLSGLCKSDYPKLEIIVLDDCSQNKRTPEIIRSFAHEGVRFLDGTPPDDNWLAKNHAYQRLFEEANGELVLFCGVDARFEPGSLRQLVYVMLKKEKSMVSLIPKNITPEPMSWQNSTLLQPLRYAWELGLPRKLFRRPPVLSTCWIIKKSTLKSAGGFAAVSRSVVPESYFARVSSVHDGYSFMQSNDIIGITSNKLFSEQWDTGVRTRYPQTHRRIELVMLLTMAEIFGLILPFLLIIAALMNKLSILLSLISLATVVMMVFAYALIVAVTYRRWLLRSVFTLPAAIVLDAILLNYSMYKYEFSEVIWKERNVCIPVMHIEPRLPAMPPEPQRQSA